MARTILITGGAGFIGAHLAGQLLAEGHNVRVLDALLPQVHEEGERPAYLDPDVELVRGDVRHADLVRKCLVGADAVVHLAARVGVGQSMYEITEYTDVNGVGTAVLLEALLEHPVERLVVASSMSIYGEGQYVGSDGTPRVAAGRSSSPVERLVVASSMSIYGEGQYVGSDGTPRVAAERSREQMEQGRWEPVGPTGEELRPVPTPETKVPALSSVYALSKYDQERLCLMFGAAYRLPTVALRFFNVYGPYQALSNPYTGVLAIFASRLLNGRPPLIFEDGEQRRDFVSVHDVARACRLALDGDDASGRALNVGSGHSVSVNEIAAGLAAILGRSDLAAEVTGRYRFGDVRHCFADITEAEHVLGYRPEVDLDQGMIELAAWLEGQVAVDRVDDATRELVSRGLA